jgi:hypothetical protein
MNSLMQGRLVIDGICSQDAVGLFPWLPLMPRAQLTNVLVSKSLRSIHYPQGA